MEREVAGLEELQLWQSLKLTWESEEFEDGMEKDFQLASRKFWQTVQ